MADAQVVHLPVVVRSCYGCVHALHGAMTRCSIVDEVILDEEATAADCEQYESDG